MNDWGDRNEHWREAGEGGDAAGRCHRVHTRSDWPAAAPVDGEQALLDLPPNQPAPAVGCSALIPSGERIAVAAAWDARRGEVKTGLPDGRPQAEIQLTTGEKTACRAFSRSGRPIPLAAAPVGPYRQDGDGNYVATFAGASPESRAWAVTSAGLSPSFAARYALHTTR